jgi:CO dehydrogenase maturation factor
MSYTIAIAGKGGVGKTTVAALLIRYLLEKVRPILAVDADPNSNLNVLLGLQYSNTVSDIREEARASSSTSLSKTDFFNLRLQEILVEGEGVDLLVMGRPEGPGCYCAINNILREHLSRLGKNYEFVVIDNEAGMEHLSRRTANSIDRLLLISDSTVVSIHSAINAFRTAGSAGLKVKACSILINKSRMSLEQEKVRLIQDSGLAIEGYIPFQEEIERESELGGRIQNIKTKDLHSVFGRLEGV